MMEACLKKRLVFGDAEQIAAIKRQRKKYEEIEEILGRKIDGPLKKYTATIEYKTTDWIEVEAPDIEAARVIADYESSGVDEFDDKDIYIRESK
jgi:hypothetical protein